jgi:hypothetical protein
MPPNSPAEHFVVGQDCVIIDVDLNQKLYSKLNGDTQR